MSNLKDFFISLGININDESLYDLAFTHPSYNADAKTKHQDYERLEYIGDSVLGFVAADLIYKNHPKMNQGNMSKLRSNIVKSVSLANYARKLNYDKHIKTGQSISNKQIAQSNKILEDVFEASLGAMYLDLDIGVTYGYIERIILDDIKNAKEDELTDAKTKLQEEMQAEYQDHVTYVLINTEGPAHDRTFTVNVTFNDLVLATGKGKSIKAAEEDAARKALEKKSV